MTSCLFALAGAAAPLQAALPGADTEPADVGGFKSDGPEWSDPFGTPLSIIRFHAAPVYRIKGDNTDPAFGGEIGVTGAFRESDPSLGLFVGWFSPRSSQADAFSYRLIPVTVRASFDAPLFEGGARLAIGAEGGYSINDFASRPAAGSAIQSTWVVGGQLGLKTPSYKRLAASLLVGYQYLKPKITTPVAGGTSSGYRDLSAPFVKLDLQF